MLICWQCCVFCFYVDKHGFSLFHKGWTLFFLLLLRVCQLWAQKQSEDKLTDIFTFPVNTVNKTLVQTYQTRMLSLWNNPVCLCSLTRWWFSFIAGQILWLSVHVIEVNEWNISHRTGGGTFPSVSSTFLSWRIWFHTPVDCAFKQCAAWLYTVYASAACFFFF